VLSLELLLDPAGERAVRAQWERLAAAGIRSLAAHTAPSNRPHVTLTLVRDLDDDLRDRLAGIAVVLPIGIRLERTVRFGAPGRQVLAWRVTDDGPLRELHRAIDDAISDPRADVPHVAPDDWTPHITLARRVSDDEAARAEALLDPPGPVRLVALRSWDLERREVRAIGPAPRGTGPTAGA
jgi:2'-5' RNA ligase